METPTDHILKIIKDNNIIDEVNKFISKDNKVNFIDRIKQMLEDNNKLLSVLIMIANDIFINKKDAGAFYTEVFDLIYLLLKHIITQNHINFDKKYVEMFLRSIYYYALFTSIQQNDVKFDFVNTIIDDANNNIIILLPFFYCNHSMSFIIRKEENVYNISFLNCGLGISYHPFKILNNIGYTQAINNYSVSEDILRSLLASMCYYRFDNINQVYHTLIYILENNDLNNNKSKLFMKIENNHNNYFTPQI